jgi:hypothetical protein
MRPSAVVPTLAVALSVAAAARAQTPPAPPPPFGHALSFLFRLGAEFGGARLGEIQIQDVNLSTQTIDAGALVVGNGGIMYQPADWAIEATIGYKVDSTHISDGRVAFTRFPLDLLVSLAPGDVRIGVGFTAHLFPRLTCRTESQCNTTLAFSHGMGAMVQLAYSRRLGDDTAVDFAARYTFIAYSGDSVSVVNGSGPGLFVGLRF